MADAAERSQAIKTQALVPGWRLRRKQAGHAPRRLSWVYIFPHNKKCLNRTVGTGGEDEDRGFKRAATKVYPFDVGQSLGDLRRLIVRQVPCAPCDPPPHVTYPDLNVAQHP